MFRKIRSVFFSVIPARRLLSRVRAAHYRATAPLHGHSPAPLTDLSPEHADRINQKSDEYFNNVDQHAYWMKKPLSDISHGPQDLWRFGLLLSALGIRPEDRVLDFGCGTGWTSVLMAQTGAEITATDISERALAVAEKSASGAPGDGARLRFQLFNGTTIDAPDGYFDFVVVFDAFHHLPNPVAILHEFARVLGPHGYLGFAEPGRGHSETLHSLRELEHGVLENEIDPEQLREAGRKVGFSELELIVPPVPPNLMTLAMPRARWYLRGLPWIVPHDYIRASILSSPIGILRKGPYVSTSLHPHGLEATIRPASSRLEARAGQTFTITAAVENTAGTVWLKAGRRGIGHVRLGGRIVRLQDQTVVDECQRTEIPRDMRQHDQCVLDLTCTAPREPGTYLVRLEMVDEGIAWFSAGGSRPSDVKLVVEP